MPKTTITVTFNRQIQPRQYETATAGVQVVREFDEDLDSFSLEKETAALFIEAKGAVFTQLGIDTIAEDGIIKEVPKAAPAPAEAPATGSGYSRTGRGTGGSSGAFRGGASGSKPKLSKEEAEQLWSDFMGRKANDFYDNLQDDEPSIKHKKTGQKLYLKYAPQWVKDDLAGDGEEPL